MANCRKWHFVKSEFKFNTLSHNAIHNSTHCAHIAASSVRQCACVCVHICYILRQVESPVCVRPFNFLVKSAHCWACLRFPPGLYVRTHILITTQSSVLTTLWEECTTMCVYVSVCVINPRWCWEQPVWLDQCPSGSGIISLGLLTAIASQALIR